MDQESRRRRESFFLSREVGVGGDQRGTLADGEKDGPPKGRRCPKRAGPEFGTTVG